MIIPNVLEIIFSIAPPILHSRLNRLWMMSQAIANLIGFMVSTVYAETDYIENLIAVEFPTLALVLIGSMIAFSLKSRKYSISIMAEPRAKTN